MNTSTQYTILLNMLIALTGASCLGAAWSAERRDANTSDSQADIGDSSEIHEESDEECLDSSKTLKRKSKKTKDTPNGILLRAAEKGDIDGVIHAIESGEADINTTQVGRFEGGRTALSYAADEGHQMVVVELIERKADINKADNFGRTPLIFAVSKHQNKVITILLEKNADVNAASKKGKTPLMFIAQQGRWRDFHSKLASQLIDANADVNATDKKGHSALLLAAQQENYKVESIALPSLIEAKADVNAALTMALEIDDLGAAGFLLVWIKTSDLTHDQKEKMRELGVLGLDKQCKCAIS